MDTKEILYPEKLRAFNKAMEKIGKEEGILDINRGHIKQFFVFCDGKKISISRKSFYIARLYRLAKFARKDFKELSRFEIDQFMASVSGRLTSWGIDSYIVTLAVFYRFSFGLTSMDRVPECLRHLKRPRGVNKIRNDMLLTKEEVDKMVAAASTVRWRAIVGVLASVGIRPGELRSLKLKDVLIKPGCIQICINEGKMAGRMGSRTVFMVEENHINTLKAWLASHPQRGSLDSWLFVEEVKVYKRNAMGKRLKDSYGKPVLEKHEWQPISERSLIEGLKRIAREAGINGRSMNAYLFRHSVATRLYKSMPTEMARRLMGHASDSSMPAVYTHLGTDDLEHALMEAYGKSNDPSKEALLAGFQEIMRCLDNNEPEKLMEAWQRAKAQTAH